MNTKTFTADDGRTYKFARLNCKALRRLDEDLRSPESHTLDTMLDAVHAAVNRATPDAVTRDELENDLDQTDLLAFFKAVCAHSKAQIESREGEEVRA